MRDAACLRGIKSRCDRLCAANPVPPLALLQPYCYENTMLWLAENLAIVVRGVPPPFCCHSVQTRWCVTHTSPLGADIRLSTVPAGPHGLTLGQLKSWNLPKNRFLQDLLKGHPGTLLWKKLFSFMVSLNKNLAWISINSQRGLIEKF